MQNDATEYTQSLQKKAKRQARERKGKANTNHPNQTTNPEPERARFTISGEPKNREKPPLEAQP